MRKLRSMKRLKTLAWQAFGKWVRKGGADEQGMTHCFTCDAKIHWKDGNASHWIHGHSKASFMDEVNVQCCCIRCNMYLSGNLAEFTIRLVKAYGMEECDRIRQLSKQIWKPNRDELEAIITKYKMEGV